MTKDELLTKKISAISLGCDKNRVDLEHMLFNLQQNGFCITENLEDAQIIIVNTCAFIEDAILEAVENIELALEYKQNGVAEKVIVAGCLPMRDKEVVEQNFPEVDAIITLNDNNNIVELLEDLYGVESKNKPKKSLVGRVITNQSAYTFLKISEGCSNGCAYCTIPKIRGRFRSIPENQIIEEAKNLVKSGYKELILVAQDTARYGEDIYGKPCFIELLKKLSKISGLEWIRLQYIYPEWVTTELLDFVINNEKICKYIDMPLQHIDDKILKAMNRRMGENQTRELVKLIKTKYPEITLRSTFIVGFPGESREQFKKLCNFIEEGNIDYASFFAFSKEEKTKAFYLPQQVSSFVKKLRLKKIVKIQNKVLNCKNVKKLGKVVDVMLDYIYNEQYMIGHSQFDSPNIDLSVVVKCEKYFNRGDIVKVKLISLCEEGFIGEIL